MRNLHPFTPLLKLISFSDRNVVFEVLEDNGTTFDLGNWLDKYDIRMDTNKGLFSNGYKVPPPVPVPETWISSSRSVSSAEASASESSSSPASVHKSKAPVSSAPQRPPGSAWHAKVREMNAKVAEVLSQSYLHFWFHHPTFTTHSGRWHSSQKTSGYTTVYHYMGRSPSLASREGLEIFRNTPFHSSL